MCRQYLRESRPGSVVGLGNSCFLMGGFHYLSESLFIFFQFEVEYLCNRVGDDSLASLWRPDLILEATEDFV